MNTFGDKPMLFWVEDLISEKPDWQTPGSSDFFSPEDFECLPKLTKAIHFLYNSFFDGNSIAGAYAYVALSMIDKIIDGVINTNVPFEVLRAVQKAKKFPHPTNRLAGELSNRLGILWGRQKIFELKVKLDNSTSSNRRGIIADIEGILREYPNLRSEIDLPEI